MSKKSPVQQITITTRTLHQLMKPVLPCADTTGMLPVLAAVEVELRDGWLVARATDRFRLGISRQPLDYGEDGYPAPAPKGVEFKALIDVSDIKHMLKLFPVGRGVDGAVTMTIDGGRLQVEAGGGLGLAFSDLRVTYHLNDGDFPNVEKLAREALTAEGDPVASFGVNHEYLAAFKAAALERGETFELIAPRQNPGKPQPLLMKVGDHFLGLLMPRNLIASTNNGREFAPAWEEFLQAGKKSEATA